MTTEPIVYGTVPNPDNDEPPLVSMPEEEARPSEFACETCGKALVYGGRGRHPRFCDEHKSRGSVGRDSRPRSQRNDAAARQAAQVLVFVNTMASMGLLGVGLKESAEALREAQPDFEEQAYAALLMDPKLCARIAKGGGASGMTALILAYGMMGMSIASTVSDEVKERRAMRALEAAAHDE